MRHSVFNHMAEAGIDPAPVQRIADHSNLSTTLNIYTHARMDGKRRAGDQYSEQLAARKLPGRKSGIVSEIGENGRVAPDSGR